MMSSPSRTMFAMGTMLCVLSFAVHGAFGGRCGESMCYDTASKKCQLDGQYSRTQCCSDGKWIDRNSQHCQSGHLHNGKKLFKLDSGFECGHYMCWEKEDKKCILDGEFGRRKCCVSGTWEDKDHSGCKRGNKGRGDPAGGQGDDAEFISVSGVIGGDVDDDEYIPHEETCDMCKAKCYANGCVDT